MKKFAVILAACALFGSTAAFADDDTPITVAQLPATAQQFIKTHFPKDTVSYAKMDNDLLDKDYTVIFTNGTKVEFRKDGQWKEVKCYQEIPSGIVPAKIREFVTKNYAGQKIVSIDRDRNDYEVKITNGLELKFDLSYRLIKVSD